ncbi:MAG: TetR/AcrR family transcriptional regulator [Acidobacteriaceae bacterium]|nr:TetR/AcrR family transcriptional regulator [Acidobacteriaceae bacterium]
MISNSRAQKKQQDILNVAQQLFLKRGYDAVSLDDILEGVGGSKTTLYSYYGGKEGLFAATVEKTCHDKLGPLLAMDLTDLDPKTALNTIGRQFLAIMSDPEGRAFFRSMISEAQRFPELASRFFASGPEVMIRLLRRNIEQWQKKGLLRSGNPEMLAGQFLGLMMGNYHLKSLLNLMDPLTEKQIKTWVARGTEIFLEGAMARVE